MCVSASTMATLYRGFNITGDNDGSVNDFMDSIEPTKTPDDCKQIDAARIAAARASACIMLLPVSLNSNQQLQVLKKQDRIKPLQKQVVFQARGLPMESMVNTKKH